MSPSALIVVFCVIECIIDPVSANPTPNPETAASDGLSKVESHQPPQPQANPIIHAEKTQIPPPPSSEGSKTVSSVNTSSSTVTSSTPKQGNISSPPSPAGKNDEDNHTNPTHSTSSTAVQPAKGIELRPSEKLKNTVNSYVSGFSTRVKEMVDESPIMKKPVADLKKSYSELSEDLAEVLRYGFGNNEGEEESRLPKVMRSTKKFWNSLQNLGAATTESTWSNTSKTLSKLGEAHGETAKALVKDFGNIFDVSKKALMGSDDKKVDGEHKSSNGHEGQYVEGAKQSHSERHDSGASVPAMKGGEGKPLVQGSDVHGGKESAKSSPEPTLVDRFIDLVYDFLSYPFTK